MMLCFAATWKHVAVP